MFSRPKTFQTSTIANGKIACRQACVLNQTQADSTNNSLNSRLVCYSPLGGLTTIVLAFPTWGVNTSGVEVALPGTYVVKASIEYPAGTFTQVTFDGASSLTVNPSSPYRLSDTMSVPIPASTVFFVKCFVTWTTADTFWLANQTAGSLSTEWTARGIGLTDQTQTVTALTPTNSAGFGPAVLTIVDTIPKTLGLLGDSICFAPDQPSPIDASKFMERAMRQQIPTINHGISGNSFSAYYVDSHNSRRLMAGRITHLISEYGTNDTFQGGMTLAQMQSNAQSLWFEYLNRGVKVWQATLTPRTTSTDSWATTANQTISSAGAEALMQSFNTWIRANFASLGLTGILEMRHAVDLTDSGKWSVDGVAGSQGAGFCTLTGGAVTAVNLASYILSTASGGTGYPNSSTVTCVVYGYPGETGVLPTITATTNGSGVVTSFNIVTPGSGLLYPPMVAPQGSWTQDGTHPSHRGFNEIIQSTGLAPSWFV